MKRGEVWWVNFDPSLGGEIRKTRPAVIVSNNAANRTQNRLQVIPLTSKVGRLYPCEAYVTVNAKLSKAMADRIATVSKQRVGRKIGDLSPSDITGIERIIRVQLGLEDKKQVESSLQ